MRGQLRTSKVLLGLRVHFGKYQIPIAISSRTQLGETVIGRSIGPKPIRFLYGSLLGPKWPNTTIFGNFQQENTVSEINSKIPLFLELELQKLEFLISFPPWHCWVGFVRLKKILRYSSLVNSSTIYIVLAFLCFYLFKQRHCKIQRF